MNRQRHLDRRVLTGYFMGETSRAESLRVSGHLLTGCAKCHELAARVVRDLRGEGLLEEAAKRAARRLSLEEAARRAERERREAPALWDELEDLSRSQRNLRVLNSPRFQSAGFVDFLVEKAKEMITEAPELALEFSDLAILVSNALDDTSYPPIRIGDLLTESLTECGNALRVLESFDECAATLDLASACLERGSGDPLVHGRLQSIRGSYLSDIGRFEESVATLQEVAKLYEVIGEDQKLGRTLAQQASVLRHFDPAGGMLAAERAMRLVNPDDEFALASARAGYVDCLNESGACEAAMVEFARWRDFFGNHSSYRVRLTTDWLAARINKEIAIRRRDPDFFECAAAQFDQLHDQLAEHGQFQQLALALLDEVELLALTGRRRRALELAQYSARLFRHRRLHLDAMQAWIAIGNLLKSRTRIERAQTARVMIQARRLFTRYWRVGFPADERIRA